MADYQARFGVGRIALVADRGLISEKNLAEVAAPASTTCWRPGSTTTPTSRQCSRRQCDRARTRGHLCRACRRHKAVRGRYHAAGASSSCSSASERSRDDRRREELLADREEAHRARRPGPAGKLVDPAKIGAAADRILRDSGVARCFSTKIRHGVFSWGFDEEALSYEEKLLAGRYVLTTSLQPEQASVTDVVRHYKMLQNVERRFRVMKDFLGLRPVHHRHRRARPRPHRALRHRRGDRSGDGQRPRSRQREGPRSARPDDLAAPGLRRAREHPPAQAERRTRTSSSSTGRQTAASDPRRLPRRGLDLGSGQNLLSCPYARRVGETTFCRAAATSTFAKRPTLPGGHPQVPSALVGLTAVFGMGTGISPPP